MRQTVDAKSKLGRKEALELARRAKIVIAAKGPRVVRYDLAKDRPTDAALLEVLLGPTGNLRAPTVVVGTTLLVGFADAAFDGVFG